MVGGKKPPKIFFEKKWKKAPQKILGGFFPHSHPHWGAFFHFALEMIFNSNILHLRKRKKAPQNLFHI